MKSLLLMLVLVWPFALAWAVVFDEEFGAFDAKIRHEREFAEVMSSDDQGKAVQEKIDAVLAGRYIEHAYAADYLAEVHSHVAEAQRDPNYSVNPIEFQSYKNLRLMDGIVQSLNEEVEYIQTRLDEVAADPTAGAQRQIQALTISHAIAQKMAALPMADKIELESSIVGKRTAQKLSPKQKSKLEKRAKKKGRDPVARANAILARKLPTALRMQRENVGPATFITPSPDNMGNVEGYRFPEGVVAMTFDDGPSKEYTMELAHAFRDHRDRVNSLGASASFFWQGINVGYFPQVVRDVLALNDPGHQWFSVNCHSWSHKNLQGASANSSLLATEVTRAINVERDAYGHDFHFYRCPYGACRNNGPVRQMLARRGLIHAFWSIDSLDWLLLEERADFKSVTEQLSISKRGIVLMHDIHEPSMKAAIRILAWIKEQNDNGNMDLHLYTIDEAVDLENQAAQNNRRQ